MIIDSHHTWGEFPLFDVSIDHVIGSEMPARQIAPGLALHPGHGLGHDRVTHDSGTPFLHPSVALAKVRASAPSTDLTDRVLRENSHAAFSGDDTCRGGRSMAAVREASRWEPTRRRRVRFLPGPGSTHRTEE